MFLIVRRKRGKPRVAVEPPQVATPAKEVLSKRRPGRPKGSKNRKKGA